MTTETATQDERGVDEFMSMRDEAESYANGAWVCEVEYVSEGHTQGSERFFDLRVPGDSIPSGLLQNLQTRGYTIVGVVSGDNSMRLTASPDK